MTRIKQTIKGMNQKTKIKLAVMTAVIAAMALTLASQCLTLILASGSTP